MSNDIAVLRQQLGMSREEFAQELGVVRTTVERWEKAQKKPRSYLENALRELAYRHKIAWPPLPGVNPPNAGAPA